MDFNTKINRRLFLRQFALLSAATPILLSACVVAPVYGPGPEETGDSPASGLDEKPPTRVSGLYSRDQFFGLLPLQGQINIQIDGTFEIEFSGKMAESSKNDVNLKDSEGEKIAITAVWGNHNNLVVTPDQPLEYASDYILTVSESSLDSTGNPVYLSGSANGKFQTTHVEVSPISVNIKRGEAVTIRVLSVYKRGGALSDENEWKIKRWQVDDSRIASVDTEGNVTGVSKGRALVQVTVEISKEAFRGTRMIVVEA